MVKIELDYDNESILMMCCDFVKIVGDVSENYSDAEMRAIFLYADFLNKVLEQYMDKTEGGVNV